MAGRRRPPRLLLADEVGLGKTIEACLVTAQQLASGRVKRVLVLVPESLVNQWFVELLRRFNLPFAIYDEERCESLEMTEPKANPFEDEQCVIASVDWLASHDKRARQALAAGWDLLLVDEAHHLVWTPEFSSPGYALVESLALRTPGLLLLTATPEQLGLGGHFARLRLLDPARYTDLDAFRAESRRYLTLSALAERLLEGQAVTTDDMATLAGLFPGEEDALVARLGRIAAGDGAERDALLGDLVDRHGTGRAMIRNRRAAVGGFPTRLPLVTLLAAPEDPTVLGRLRAEFAHDVGDSDDEPEHDYAKDPRTDWLLGILDQVAPAKVLLLCRSRAKVQALEEALRLRSGLQVARFHEDMNLLQRDRNAAFFADPEGARLLIASEIGAEGRNFQFAQHLVLWDLPLHPDMLEQRIGRLDRIGQKGDVNIHAAAVTGSAQEVLLRLGAPRASTPSAACWPTAASCCAASAPNCCSWPARTPMRASPRSPNWSPAAVTSTPNWPASSPRAATACLNSAAAAPTAANCCPRCTRTTSTRPWTTTPCACSRPLASTTRRSARTSGCSTPNT